MKLTRFSGLVCVGIVCFMLLGVNAFSQNQQIVAGAGPSTEICKLFFSNFSKLDGVGGYSFSVMDGSVKHKGGILNSDKFLFGRTGRPLTQKEKDLGKEQIFLAKVPVTFAKGVAVKVSALSMKDIEELFSGEIDNWKKNGGSDAPVLLVGREQTEALFMTLKEEYPFFKKVKFNKIFKKDHEVVKFLKTPEGSHAIAFGAKPNFDELNMLSVKGFESGVSVGLVYDLKNEGDPIVALAKDYANSNSWKKVVSGTSMLNID